MIFVTGDVHCPHDIKKLNMKSWPEQKALTRNDYLIVCGDMGIVWEGNDREDRYWQEWFEDKPYTTLFVDGNHENHVKLNSYLVEEWKGGKVHKIRPHVYHLMRGQVYDIDGLKVFAMGGAASHDKEYRTEGRDWWPEEMPSNTDYCEAIENLEQNNWRVDIVVSHCTADSIQKELAYWYEHDKLTNFFEAVVKSQVEYDHWYFGHYHDDINVDEKHHCVYHEIRKVDAQDD